jgi:hypothetical protein
MMGFSEILCESVGEPVQLDVPFGDMDAGIAHGSITTWRCQGRMARELQLAGRRYWIISDPYGEGWKARVVELHEGGEADEIGIEASDQTRTAADDSAERKLRRLLRLPLD